MNNIPAGKHAVIIGQNGSGKSQMLMYLARHNSQRVVIFDTKIDNDFLSLARGDEVLQVANNYQEMIEILNRGDFDYLILRPQDFELSEPEALDNYLKALAKCKNLSIFIDEAYQLHTAGRAYPGYISILTRGRSRNLSLIVCTQRPSWVSTFTFSEPSYFFVYRLILTKDIKKVSEFVPIPEEWDIERFAYYFYCIHERSVVRCKPINIFSQKVAKQNTEKKINIYKKLFK